MYCKSCQRDVCELHRGMCAEGDSKLLLDPSNFEILCRRCHRKEHQARGDLVRAA